MLKTLILAKKNPQYFLFKNVTWKVKTDTNDFPFNGQKKRIANDVKRIVNGYHKRLNGFQFRLNG